MFIGAYKIEEWTDEACISSEMATPPTPLISACTVYMIRNVLGHEKLKELRQNSL